MILVLTYSGPELCVAQAVQKLENPPLSASEMLGSPTGASGLPEVLFLRLPGLQSSGPLLSLPFLSASLGRLALFLPRLYVFLFLLVFIR